MNAGLKLSFSAPATGEAPFDEYVSDPAKPVPYRARPVQAVGYSSGMTWSQWLVDDQREASGRPDVAVFVSDFLSAPVKISGQPIANVMASTSGTDSDWVVKLIDLYPDEVGRQPEMGAYQLMVAADIFRGRYRESFETPKALVPDKPLLYRFALPTANHVFLPGHRIMVGSRCTIAIRRLSSPIFSGLSPATIAKRRSASTTHPARPLSSSCRWLPRPEVWWRGADFVAHARDSIASSLAAP